MSTCNYTTTIDENLCIGDSLPILNSNFSNLDTAACNLSSSESSIISNLVTFSNVFNNNMFSLLNLINSNVSSPTNITSLATPTTVFSKSLNDILGSWQCPNTYNTLYTGSFNLGSYSIPSTAKFILLRADDASYSNNYSRSLYVNVVQIYVASSPTAGLSIPYTTISKTSINSVVFNYSINSSNCIIPSDWTTKINLRIVGYY